MRGTIVILNEGRISDETVAWLREQPRDWWIERPRGEQIAQQRNEGIEKMVGECVVFVDSDSVPPLDAIERLLAYNVELIGGVVLERRPPFDVCAVRTLTPWTRITLAETVDMIAAMPVVAVGTGCMLIKRSLIERMTPPYFQVGQRVRDLLTEDTDFCLRAFRHGAQPYLACDVRVGHATRAIVYPHEDGKLWVRWEDTPYLEPLEPRA